MAAPATSEDVPNGAPAPDPDGAARRAIERVARDAYGRLVAFLTARTRDVAAAQDALADAFLAALEVWPRTGVPATPEAWLLTAARRRLLDAARHAHVRDAAAPALRSAADAAMEVAVTAALTVADHDVVFPDDRLGLLFLCAHPAIDPAVRTPLMLQTVLGLDAARIASAFLVKPATMGQRLTRAKGRIRDAGIPFALPGESELPGRLGAVLEAVYAAFGSGWEDVGGAEPGPHGLTAEAIHLGRVLVQLLPDQPEPHALLALMLHCEARRDARRGPAGEYVPLAEQDVARWRRPLVDEAERSLLRAAELSRGTPLFGRFQLEAAIQSAHARRATTGRTDWEAIALLYEGLVRHTPAIGALVGRAAAVGEARGPSAGWELLQFIPADAVAEYLPYWALAAHLHARMHRTVEADAAYRRALALCKDSAVRDFLARHARVR